MWRLLVLILAAFIALIAGRVATAQKTAFTADGARVYPVHERHLVDRS